MLVNDKMTTWNTPAILGTAHLLADFTFGRMKLLEISRNLHLGGVVPRPFADAITSMDGCFSALGLRAEISAPRFTSRAGFCRQRLTMFISAFDAT